MTGQPVCPQCSTPVELDWEWCHHCGFDPEGKRPPVTPLLSARSQGHDGGGSAGLPSFGPTPADPLPTFGGLGDDTTGFDLGDGPGGGLGHQSLGPRGIDAGTGFATSSAFEDADVRPGADPFGGPAPSFGASSLGDAPGSSGVPDSWGAPPPSSFGSDLLSAPTPRSDGFSDPFITEAFGPGGHGASGGGMPGADPFDDGPAYGSSLSPSSPLLPPPTAGGSFGGVPSGQPGGFTIPTRPMGSPVAAGPPEGGKRRAVSLPTDDSPVLKFVAIALAGILAVGAVTLILVRASGEERPHPSATTLDPSAPPPIGQLPLGGRTTTTAGAAAAPDGLAPGWVTYRSPDGSFTVNFPGHPTARGYQRSFRGFIQNGLEAWLQVGTDGPIYSAAYIDLPSGGLFADSQDAFDQLMANAADAGDAFEFAPGLVGVQFTEKPSRNFPGRGVVLAKGRRIYVLEAANVSDEDYDRFLRGFHWLADV